MGTLDIAARLGAGRINVKMFFDTPKVESALDKGERQVLAKFGQAVRVIARRSMKKVSDATVASAPGTPPNAHTGFMRDSLAFQYEPGRNGVIVGSLRGHRVADLHEFGGTVWKNFASWVMGRKTITRKPVDYPARPYLAPAFETAKSDVLPGIFETVYNKGQFNG